MEQKTYSFRIHGIDIIEKSLFRAKTPDEDIFSFDIKTQSKIDADRKLVITFVSVEVKKTNTTEIIGRIMIGCGFFIENFEQSLLVDAQGNMSVPSELEGLLKSISISTMRGIMFSEFRGTQLHNAILPIIVIDSLVPVEGKIIEA